MFRRSSLLGLCAAFAITLLGHPATCVADEVVTPDKAEYADKIAKEVQQLRAAKDAREQLDVIGKMLAARLAEMEAVIDQNKFEHVPQLVAVYDELIRRSKHILDFGQKTAGFGETAARAFLAEVFAHKARLSALAAKVSDEKQAIPLRTAAASAEDIRSYAMRAWRGLPEGDRGGTLGTVNVRINVQMTETGKSEKLTGGITWRHSGDRVAVGSKGDLLRRNGLRVGYGRGRLRVAAAAQSTSTRTNKTVSQFVVTLNDRPATIDVGTRYREPVPLLIYSLGTGRAYVVNTYELVRAGARLTVLPTVLSGGWIRVQITPRLSYYDRGRKTLKLQELSTTVTVRNGQSIVIGGLDSKENTVGRVLFGVTKDNSLSNRLIILTPTVIDTPTILK